MLQFSKSYFFASDKTETNAVASLFSLQPLLNTIQVQFKYNLTKKVVKHRSMFSRFKYNLTNTVLKYVFNIES